MLEQGWTHEGLLLINRLKACDGMAKTLMRLKVLSSSRAILLYSTLYCQLMSEARNDNE